MTVRPGYLTIPLMPKVERSVGRKALERIAGITGTGAIVAGISEDSKAVALGGIIALGCLGWLKWKDGRSRSIQMPHEAPGQTGDGSEALDSDGGDGGDAGGE